MTKTLEERIAEIEETAQGKSWDNDPEAIKIAQFALEIIRELQNELETLKSRYSQGSIESLISINQDLLAENKKLNRASFYNVVVNGKIIGKQEF